MTTGLASKVPASINPPIEEEHVKELRKLRKVHGERDPVKIAVFPDGSKTILDGRHRREAGWTSTQEIKVKSVLDFLDRRIDSLENRKATETEWTYILTAYCEELIKDGMPAEKTASFVAKNVSPFEDSYTYQILPRRFKSNEGRPPGWVVSTDRKLEEGPLPEGLIPSRRDDMGPLLIKCSWCGHEGVVLSRVLQEPPA